jgi:hypothetical protein
MMETEKTLSDEDRFREQLRREEEEAMKKALTPKPDPHSKFEAEARREIETDEEREKRQAANRAELERNNGFSPDFDPASQKGLEWRAIAQKKVREYFSRGASHEWVLWKMKRDMGILTSTARRIIEDALEHEPEKEPEGSPVKRKRG